MKKLNQTNAKSEEDKEAVTHPADLFRYLEMDASEQYTDSLSDNVPNNFLTSMI
ncbi:hypothetical protein A2U01_0040335 [Trifolium medium]|uniref:Uncharacterized protein n=1 Tax=Trifolium medium TaxID=97028 RepID=A0A392Q633_9FABA|nr:hypothetical protein [Trifolium medium]